MTSIHAKQNEPLSFSSVVGTIVASGVGESVIGGLEVSICVLPPVWITRALAATFCGFNSSHQSG